jgi:phosphocarrier protein
MRHTFKHLSRDVIINNELGLHARSAAKIAKIAQNATANVWVIRDNEKVDAKSIIDLLTLACAEGTKITLQIDDPADFEILDAILQLIERGFGE